MTPKHKTIARVFPVKTRHTPIDQHSYIGLPDTWTQTYSEIHISVTFTWDLPKIPALKKAWAEYGKVIIGGPATGESKGEFINGMYLKRGNIMTSRGCPNNCPHCLVKKREGDLQELPIVPGHEILDNNFLACSKFHKENVFRMLSRQREIEFNGGLENCRITDYDINLFRSVRIKELWMAYDMPEDLKPLKKATAKLRKYFSRSNLRCFVLIGYGNDTIQKAEGRLMEAWDIGVTPFAMLYLPPTLKKKQYPPEWYELRETWTIYKKMHGHILRLHGGNKKCLL